MTTLEHQIQLARTYLAPVASRLRRVGRDERGQAATEYLGVVAVVAAIVIALIAFGDDIATWIYTGILQKIFEVLNA